MINFILCSNIKNIKLYQEEINNYMMNYDMEYKTYVFTKYNEKFTEIIQKELGFKVYILDIDDDISHLQSAKIIREDYDDWSSMIIILSNINKSNNIDGKHLMIIDMTNKMLPKEKVFKEILAICIKHYDKRPKKLRYIYKNMIYSIDYKQIMYIEKEPDSKLCRIKTTEKEYFVPGSINEILNKLDNRFIKCYRSIIINLEQVESFDIKKNIIYFKSKDKLETISRDKRKDILNYMRGIRKERI